MLEKLPRKEFLHRQMWNLLTGNDAAERQEFVVVTPGHLSRTYLSNSAQLWSVVPRMVFHTGYRIAGTPEEVRDALRSEGISDNTIAEVLNTAISKNNYQHASINQLYGDEMARYQRWRKQFSMASVDPAVPPTINLTTLPVATSSSQFTLPPLIAPTSPVATPSSSTPTNVASSGLTNITDIENAIRVINSPVSCETTRLWTYNSTWNGPPGITNQKPGFEVGRIVVIVYSASRTVKHMFGYVSSMTGKGSLRVKLIPLIHTTRESDQKFGESYTLVTPNISALRTNGFVGEITIRYSKRHGYSTPQVPMGVGHLETYCNREYFDRYYHFD